MPFLALVHLKEMRCPQCGALLAQAGARSFIVYASGCPVLFDEANLPEEMRVELTCSRGHTTGLVAPDEISAEETMVTPDDAPVGVDAKLMEN